MIKNVILSLLFTVSVFAQSSTKSIMELKSKKFTRAVNHNSLNILSEKPKKKSIGLGIIYSLLLPGMGELYAESYQSGKYFTIADGMLWSVLAGFDIYGINQRNNYRAFAQSFGNVSSGSKEDKFYADIGFYDSVDDFNKEKELNRDFNNTYDPKTHYWRWESDSQRKEFRNMWSSSENAFNNIRFAVGALILNRIVSAINAVRLIAAYNKNISTGLSWNISFGVQNKVNLPSTFEMKFSTHF